MLIKDNIYNVAKFFFDFPERDFHLRELARLTELSAPGIIKIIKKLENAGLVKVGEGKFVKSIKASKTRDFIIKKRLYNIDLLFSSGFVDFLRDKYEEPEAMILFGSYSRGEDSSKSDVDIAVITSKKINLNLNRFEGVLNRKINVLELKVKDCENELLNNLANGVVLYGYCELPYR